MALLEPELGQLPASPEFDSNFLFYEDALFTDRDFELLFQDITDAEGPDLEALGLRLVNLRPDRWFLPFPGRSDSSSRRPPRGVPDRHRSHSVVPMRALLWAVRLST